MHTLRPIKAHISKRPDIREIAASILAPSTSCCRARQFHCISSSLCSTTRLSRQRHAIRSSQTPYRTLHSSPSRPDSSSQSPKSHNRGPPSEETTQTDFSILDVLGNTPVPSTSIDACVWDGFHLNSGAKIMDGDGVLLIGGEAFGWRPWNAGNSQEGKRLLNDKGQWEVGDEAWGVLGVVWPKPDLLILGLGPLMGPLSPATRRFINGLGIRVDIQDTRNAAAQFNLLATERGVSNVAAALVPLGWREGVGVM